MTISDYQMGVLTKPEQGRVRAHLDRCPHCRAELSRLLTFLAPEASAPQSEPSWAQATGFEWQRVRETGQVLIRLLGEALSPPQALQPAFVAIKGQAHGLEEQDDVVCRITLDPDETGDLDIEAIVRRDQDDPELGILVARVQSPSRWPELAGTLVQAGAGDWQAEGTTDDDGMVTLTGLPLGLLDVLSIQVVPPNRSIHGGR
jgi:hypothetical protein